MLHGKLQVVQSASLDLLEETKFFLDIGQWLGESELLFLVRDRYFWSLWSILDVIRYQSENELVWDKADHSSDRDRQETENDGVSPLCAIQSDNVESCASDEDNHDLATDHDTVDTHEKVIPSDAFKDVKLVIKSAVAEL